jgi:hypothetical protein
MTLKLEFWSGRGAAAAASLKGGAADPEKPGRRRPARQGQRGGEVDPTAKVLVERAINRRIGDRGHTLDNFVRDKAFSGTVLKKGREQDDGPRRQSRYLGQ